MMLVVVSKMKAFIKEKAQLSTSMEAAEILSSHIETLLNKSATLAAKDGRKTVMGRDMEQSIKGDLK